MYERVSKLEVQTTHLADKVEALEEQLGKFAERMEAVEKKVIVLVAASAGAGTAVVQALLHVLGVK